MNECQVLEVGAATVEAVEGEEGEAEDVVEVVEAEEIGVEGAVVVMEAVDIRLIPAFIIRKLGSSHARFL